MRSFHLVLAVLAVAAARILPQNIEEVVEKCDEVCEGCGGNAVFVDTVCICSLQHTDQATKECARDAMVHYNESKVEWRVHGRNHQHTFEENNQPKLRVDQHNRLKRNVDTYNKFYNYGGQAIMPLPALPGVDQYKPPTYELSVGSDEDSVQLVFPGSSGIDVEHEYYLRDLDGYERPIHSSLVERAMNQLDWRDDCERDSWNDDEPRYSF